MVKENDLGEILAQELERIKECGGRINLSEIERRTGIGRSVLRRWQGNGYELKPSRKGWRAGESKLNKVAEAVDGLLRKGVTNSSVIFDRIRELGYDGGISILKDYIRAHHDLVPAQRQSAGPMGNMVRNAGFPAIKCIDDYDMSELRLPEPMTVDYLKNLVFIKDKHSLIMHGICGSGKTMLAICLGMEACRCGYKVRFFTLAQLAVRLKTAAQEERLENFLLSLRNLDLLIIDEWGYTSVDSESAGYLFRVVADSYEQKSLIITTNLAFSDWGRLFADEQLAAAIIDRIVHYGHLVDTGKKDWRLSCSPMNGKQFVRVVKKQD